MREPRNRKPGKSGYKGVHKLSPRHIGKPWQARIDLTKDGKPMPIYIGQYETPELAHIARIKFIDSLK